MNIVTSPVKMAYQENLLHKDLQTVRSSSRFAQLGGHCTNDSSRPTMSDWVVCCHLVTGHHPNSCLTLGLAQMSKFWFGDVRNKGEKGSGGLRSAIEKSQKRLEICQCAGVS